MKTVFFILAILVLVVIMQPAFAATEIEFIELEGLEWKKIELENSDVLRFELLFSNNGNSNIELLFFNFALEDSQNKLFNANWYLDPNLKNKVTETDCPDASINMNPGLTGEIILCFEVAKNIGTSVTLKIYSRSANSCIGKSSCDVISLPLELVSELEKSITSAQKIPDWVKNTMQWYLDGLVSEDEMINALQFLIKEGIIKV